MVIELRAVRADGFNEISPDRCWANREKTGQETMSCGDTDTDALGLCPFHRVKLFGEPDTTG